MRENEITKEQIEMIVKSRKAKQSKAKQGKTK